MNDEFQSNPSHDSRTFHFYNSSPLFAMQHSNTHRSLWFFVAMDGSLSQANVPITHNIDGLKKAINEALLHLCCPGVPNMTLVKLRDPIPIEPSETLKERIEAANSFVTLDNPSFKVLDVFPELPAETDVHIIVKHRVSPPVDSSYSIFATPETLQHRSKRPRVESYEPRSPRISGPAAEREMAAALAPFTRYMTYLAEGKLDGYFTSIQTEALTTYLDFGLPIRPTLLFHDLSKFPDDPRLPYLFSRDTVHLYAVSGSGKTRLSLEGLGHNWGFYISCRGGLSYRPCGSKDFELATKAMEEMSGWDNNPEPCDKKNLEVARRSFAMLICARIFILRHLLKNIPSGTEATVARQRWVLIQAMPPFTGTFANSSDIFARVFESLRQADTKDMLDLMESMITEMTQLASFSPRGPFFVVVDEAQVAADYLKDPFCSVTGTYNRLHAFYRFLREIPIIKGVILAGTGLSKQMVMDAVNSQTAQMVDTSPNPILFTDVGRFKMDEGEHEAYIRKYLPSLDPNSNSHRRLVDRILYWFSGRYRFTASLIELLLIMQLQSPHRILTLFAEALTGFTITDAVELEDLEPPLTFDAETQIRRYGTVGTADRLFQRTDQNGLITCLFHALMRWRVGSQRYILIENYMHETIILGIGHLAKIRTETLNSKIHPVYLCEPLAVLYLSSLFAKHNWTTKEAWIKQALNMAPNNQTRGFIFEEALLLVLLQMFGGKARPLSDAFHTNQPWGSRMVTLVSLQRRSDGKLDSNLVSWTSGTSDRLGYKATSPVDVLRFLNNPAGKCFLFPDIHMGPDLVFFVQDVETKELIVVLVQGKFMKRLNPEDLWSALNSVNPEFFYTVTKKDGKREQYSPLKYPGLSTDLMGVLGVTLGPAEHKPSVDDYLKKLRSSTKLDEKFASSLPLRETPRVLRIIATPDDKQGKRLKEERRGDLGFLRWDCVERYLGEEVLASLEASLSAL